MSRYLLRFVLLLLTASKVSTPLAASDEALCREVYGWVSTEYYQSVDEQVLVRINDRGGLAAGLSQFIDSIYNSGGNSELLANSIRSNFVFTSGSTYIDDLVKLGAQADRMTKLTKETAEWQEIIKMLEALDGASAGKK